jgi:capsular polysaccharide transport system permease protein
MRFARNPAEWFWMLAEPVGHIALLIALFVIGFRQREIAGVDTGVFIMFGVLAIFMPRNLAMRSVARVIRGDPLYGYQQVKPVDIVFARAALESLLWCVLFLVVWSGAALFRKPVAVDDPLLALSAGISLWLVAMGLALTCSVIANLSAQVRHLIRMLIAPLYLLSAVIYPSLAIPIKFRETLLLNPLVHSIESLRVAFMPAYKIPLGIDVLYPVKFGVVLIFLGLALHARYAGFLRAK